LFVEVLEDRTVLSGLTLTLATHTLDESTGTTGTTATVTRVGLDNSQDMTVNLSSGDSNQVSVPASVVIPARQTSATFDVTALDGSGLNGSEPVVISASVAGNGPVGIDTGFGSNGYASVPMIRTWSSNFPDVKVQPDGKIVAASGAGVNGASWSVSRVNPDGTPDASFGTNGTVNTTFPGATIGHADGISFQPDGKIIVNGRINGGGSNYDSWAIARYNPDGSLDTTFGSQGLLRLQFTPSTGYGGWSYDTAVLPNGDILVGGTRFAPATGFSVARLTPTGQLDSTFGTGGLAGIEVDPHHSYYNETAQDMLVQPDGKIILVGFANFHALAVARLNADGTADTSFNGTGVQLIEASTFGSQYSYANGGAVALQPDGRILVTGYIDNSNNSNSDWAVARLNADGSLDTTFNGTGVASQDWHGLADYAQDVIVQVDGKIVVAGSDSNGTDGYDLAFARYNADGTLDTSFNGTGQFTMPVYSSVFEEIWAVDLQTDGKLVGLAGYANGMEIVRVNMNLYGAADTVTVVDNESPPQLTAPAYQSASEGISQMFDLGSIADGSGDAPYSVDVNWGDGSADTLFTQAAAGALTGQAHAYDDEGTYEIHISVTNADSNESAVTEFHATVSDVAPTAGLTGPTDGFQGVSGQARTFMLTASSPSQADQANGFTFQVNWDDGTAAQTITGFSGTAATHAYAAPGTYSISMTATDGDGESSAPATLSVTIRPTEQQGSVLAVGGTGGDDSFVLTPGTTSGTIGVSLNGSSLGTFNTSQVEVFGGAGNDHVTVQGTSAADACTINSTSVSIKGVSIGGADIESWTVNGLGGNNTFAINGSGLGATLLGGAGNDTFTVAKGVVFDGSIDGGGGTNTVVGGGSANTWIVTGANAGTLNGTLFVNIANLTGGSAADSFTIDSGASLTGMLNGGGGTNTLDYSAYGSGVTVNLQTHAATAVGSFTNIQSLVGSGSGANTLIAANVSNTWNITGHNAGKVGSLAFAAIQNLAGGSGADVFRFSNGKGVDGSIDGGSGINWLNYSLYTSGVNSNLSTGTATGAGGGVANIQNIIGGAGNNTLTGGASGGILVGRGGNDVITGGSGCSLLIGGKGSDQIIGGSSDDIVIGGTTTYDTNTTALLALLAEWQRTDETYQQRIDHLRGVTAGGLNGNYFLNVSTVSNLSATDTLTGGDGMDWFWAHSQNEITDLQSGEQVN
jgi:uncharacterized delta-60 repeat protein